MYVCMNMTMGMYIDYVGRYKRMYEDGSIYVDLSIYLSRCIYVSIYVCVCMLVCISVYVCRRSDVQCRREERSGLSLMAQ